MCGDDLVKQIELLRNIGLHEYEREEKHLQSTGYTRSEIKRIIDAFDGTAKKYNPDSFVALNAVIDVLNDIHQVIAEGPEPAAVEATDVKRTIMDILIKRHQAAVPKKDIFSFQK